MYTYKSLKYAKIWPKIKSKSIFVIKENTESSKFIINICNQDGLTVKLNINFVISKSGLKVSTFSSNFLAYLIFLI